MKRHLLFIVALLAVACGPLKAQVPTCESGVPYFYYNFVGHPAMDTVSPTHSRNDQCCGGPNNAPFTSFEVVMDTGAAMISFEFARDVDPGQSTSANSMYWQLNCGPHINIDTAVCLTSAGTNYITFAKPGNNANTYRVRSIAKPIFPRPDSVRIGCSHVISILGMDTATVTFQSITGTPGQYNNLLSCTTGCVNPVYTPVVGVPAIIQYLVCGTPQATACGYAAVCDTVTIYNFAPLTVIASPNPAIFCAGGAGETSIATPGGGLSPYTYFWRNSSSAIVSSTNSYSTNIGGAYSIEVRDMLYEPGRCSTIAVSVPFVAVPPPTVNAGLNQTVCPGAPAILQASFTSATGVIWSGGAGTYSPSNTSALVSYIPTPAEVLAGSVTLTATTTGAGGGCTNATDQVTITYPSALAVSVADQNLSCSGDSTTISGVITNGTAPFTYAWSTRATSTSIFSGAGTYCLTVTDALGCSATDCGNVTTPAPLTLSMSSIDCSTNISTDGSATAFPGGGTPPYSYFWNTGATTQTISSLAFGVYSVTVTDASGCTISASVVVNKPLCFGFQATTTSTNVLCYGNKSGTATANPVGGSGAYSYVWNTVPAQTTQTATNLVAGVYQVAVIDMITGCVHITNVTITQPPQLTTTTTQSNVTTIGGNNGSATVNAFGGTPGYTYLWSNGNPIATANALSAGTYSVTVTDANGCVAQNSVLINQPPCDNLTAAVNATPVTCAGGTNGTATAITLFATPPLTYLWSTGATTQSISGLGAGTYSVSVTDAVNCPAIVNFTITQPSPFVANAIGTNVICSGEGDGTVELFVSGGTFPYSYLWSNGLSVQDQTGLGGGTYTVTVTDANGCTTTASGVVVDPSPLIIPSSVTPVTCFGGSNGAIDINPTGGTPGYTYSWTNTATIQDISGLTAGGYTVTVTDVNGCTASKQYWVSHPDVVSDSFSIACPIPGSGVATVTVVPSGGNSVFYQLSYNNGGNYSASGVYTTTLPVDSIYLLQVRDSLGCTMPITDIIAIDPSVAISAVTFNPCVPDGATTVPVTVTATGGNGGPLSISFDGGLTYLAPGVFTANLPVDSTYTLVVKDSSDCGSMTQTFTINPEIVPSAVVASYAGGFNVTCFGSSDGNINVSVTGGSGSYTYAWSNSATTQDLTNVTAASYSVVITDGLGCRDTASYTLTQPTLLTATATATTDFNGYEIRCFGGTNGAIDLTPGGGTTGYTYNWSSSATTQDLSGLGIGTYSVTVTDANGCTATASVVMTQPTALATTTTVVPVACFGNSTASIDLGVTGGVTNYTYLWSNAATTQDLTNIPLGTYSITVTDANSCTTTTTATITEPPLLTSSGTVTNLTCFQSGNGGIDVSVSGGVSTYTYAWSNAATTQDLSSLTANTYSVTITDQNGCTNTLSFTVTQPTLLTATAAATTDFNGYEIRCFGGTNGAIDLTPGGGTTGYTYNWSSSATTQDLSGLGIGTYSVTVTDANGCTATASVVMTQPTALATTTALTQILCNGDSSGVVDLGVSGGVTAYTFAWSNGTTTEDISGIPIGTYSVTVTDANSCTTTASVVITEPTLLVASGVVTNLTCFQAGNGSIDITANGGVSPYNYLWNNSASTQDVNNLSSGSYDVVITDENGCNDTLTFAVTEPALLTAVTTATTDFNGYQISCNGNTDGAIDLQVAGGTFNYSYLWSTGDTTEDIAALGAGTYIVNITDSMGCTVVDTLVLNEPAALGTSVAAQQVYCNGFNTGSIDLTVGGGVAPFVYLWSTTDTTQDLSNLIAGIYSVTISDANGCIIIDSAVVIEPTPLVFSDSVVNLNCFQSNDGSINLTVGGGLVPYSYAWSSGQTSEDVGSLSAGVYTVIISDSAACGDTLSFTITEPLQLTIAASVDTSFNGYEIRCNGLNDGTITTSYAGGTPGYTFAWSTGENTPNLDSLVAGTYIVFVTDSNGCTAADTIVLNEPALITFAGPHQDVLCNAFETGSIDGSTNGGVTPYAWLWSNGEVTEDIDSLAVGVYNVTITDGNGCTLDSSITITEMSPVLSTHVSANVLCFGNQDGLIDVTVIGGGSPYVYTWSSGQTTEDLSGVGPGTYIIVITDTNNCTHNDTIYIVEPTQLTSSVYSPVSSNGYNVSGYGATDGSVDLTVAGGTSPYQYAWSNGPITEDLSGLGAGTYIVSVIDSNGCAVSDTIVITEPLDLEMPTGYSPNGDGANDFFVVHGIESFPDNKLEVFNRWGNLVYDAYGYHNQWRGTSDTGDELPDGTYFVILTINDGAIELHGYVDIRR